MKRNSRFFQQEGLDSHTNGFTSLGLQEEVVKMAPRSLATLCLHLPWVLEGFCFFLQLQLWRFHSHAVFINDHGQSCLKQEKFTFLQFWRPQVQNLGAGHPLGVGASFLAFWILASLSVFGIP